MYIYLPITEMATNIFSLIALGGGVGFLSGLLGVSGGFLLTPILILIGIPSSIAVASQSACVIATATTGSINHWYKKNVDFKMAGIMFTGGLAGSSLGVWVFTMLRTSGHLDATIKLSYVIFLGAVAFIMMAELFNTHRKKKKFTRTKLHQHNWLHRLPLKTKFKKSRLYISIIPPILIGLFVGFLSALMGVGGGFIMVPAMIYLLGIHTSVVVGTSLFQGIFVAVNATFWQAYVNHTVDLVLAFILIIGGVCGAKIGANTAGKLKAEQLRFILAFIVSAVALSLFIELMVQPNFIHNIVYTRGAN